jgi:tRNA wybutosine-synthesizing protein 1
MQSLEIMSKLKTTTVLRITLIKGWTMVHPEEYAKLIEKASPKFIEIKAYMWIGFSKQRLEITNMPKHEEVKEFAEQILKHLKNYKLKDEKKESRVVLLA